MKPFAACCLSAFLAVLAAEWWSSGGAESLVTAQDRLRRRSSASGPVEDIAPQTARLYDDQGLTAEEEINVAVYEAVNRGVVNITAVMRNEPSQPLGSQSEASGSGSVLNSDGHILTNYHVVENAKAIHVSLYNGESYEARLVGADRLNDLAIVHIDAPKMQLFPVQLGDSRELRVGMRVYAVGNPFGLERTLTTGIISSLNRSLEVRKSWTIKSIIQTDADINPGSSGGPLLDSHGRLIGINTAIASNTGQSAGVGFAIPSSLILRVLPQLLSQGRVEHPEIGIARLYQTDQGLLVAQLHPNGPAEKAGLLGPKMTQTRRGSFVIERVNRSAADVIVAVDEKKVATVDDFLNHIDQKHPGDKAELTVVRNGRKLKIAVHLAGPSGQSALTDESGPRD
jgi:S1-C subfamily serine protease